MRAMSFLCFFILLSTPLFADPWQDAERNGEQARQAFLACSRFVDGWMQHADSVSGLIPRNLTQDFYWNAKDAKDGQLALGLHFLRNGLSAVPQEGKR